MSRIDSYRIEQSRRAAEAAARRQKDDSTARVDAQDVQRFRNLRRAGRPSARKAASPKEAARREEAGGKKPSSLHDAGSTTPGAPGATTAGPRESIHRRERESGDHAAGGDGRNESGDHGVEGLSAARTDAGVESGAAAATTGNGGSAQTAAQRIDQLCDQVLLADADMSKVDDLRLVIKGSLLPDTTLHVTRQPDGGLLLNFDSGAAGSVGFLHRHRETLATRASTRSGMKVSVRVTARDSRREGFA